MLEQFGGCGFLRIPQTKGNGCALCGLETSKARVTHFFVLPVKDPVCTVEPPGLVANERVCDVGILGSL